MIIARFRRWALLTFLSVFGKEHERHSVCYTEYGYKLFGRFYVTEIEWQ